MNRMRKTYFATIAAVAIGLMTSVVSAAELRMSSQWTENTAGAKVDKWWASEIAKGTFGAKQIQESGLAKYNPGIRATGSWSNQVWASWLAACNPGIQATGS